MTLDELAIKYDSDKSSLHHNYCPIYEHYFGPLRDRLIVLFELGIGGYHHIDRGGASLRMWYEYFTKAKIFGVDIYAKGGLNNDRIETILASQDSEKLQEIVERVHPNIIIDDASHINPLTICTFENIWKHLHPGGLYIIEDIESSWSASDAWAQGCDDYRNYDYPSTINFFRQVCDEINAQYIPHYQKRGYDDIESIHFHKNLIVVKKKA